MSKAEKPNVIAEAFARTTKLMSEGGPRPLPRRFITFTVDHTICLPGVFDQDFELTLGSLTTELELAALNVSKGDPVGYAMAMARMSIVSVNGHALDRAVAQDEWLWEVLGTGGRQMVAAMFAKIGTPDGDAVKKAHSTLRIH